MLWDWLVELAETVIDLIVGYLPLPPGWLLQLPAKVSQATGLLGPMGRWVDLAAIGIVMPSLILLWIGFMALHIIRMVVSHFSGGGGSV